METPSTPSQTQTWITAVTGIAAAIAAVLAKKRFARKPAATASHTGLEALAAKLDANHKELVSALTAQTNALAAHAGNVERRLDALESTVARLDERTKILSTFGASELAVPILHKAVSSSS